MAHDARRDGFTLVELMVVVLIIGILVAVAVPVFGASRESARQRTCLANQRTLEGAVETWLAVSDNRRRDQLVGLVNGAHPIVVGDIVAHPPVCPSAVAPANRDNPTAAEGAYTFDVAGTVQSCAFGTPAHGHFRD